MEVSFLCIITILLFCYTIYIFIFPTKIIQVLNITFVNFIEAPYDAIHVGAAAHPIPDALIKQLKPGGRLFIPVGPTHGDQWLEQIDKDKDGNIVRQRLMGVRYVPLTDRAQQIWRN